MDTTMKLAFSTVATPERTLDRVLDFARRVDVDGVEFRTFGDDSSHFTPDPCLTSFPKIRGMCADAGVQPACLATSIAFDEPVSPPVVGRLLGDYNRSVMATRRMIEVATQIECPLVRVFGFELHGRESRRAGMRRVVERLQLACACARNTGVRLLIENGGSFPTAEDLAEIMDRTGSSLLAAAYSPAVGQAVGEDPIAGINLLGQRLESVKIKDFRGTTPVPVGEGEMRCEETIRRLGQVGYRGWVVIEWDRMWLSGLADAEQVIPQAVQSAARWYYSAAGSVAVA
ncbi:MAG: sugar phosphate isomerase/epimerase [Phycisphaerales bacterium]|nr:sugar phosphate isomerase/epimerase [Phycisphaerales bacterium]